MQLVFADLHTWAHVYVYVYRTGTPLPSLVVEVSIRQKHMVVAVHNHKGTCSAQLGMVSTPFALF
jgi:hypothetical protein